ncbi:MAG: PEP-CTERM sorting domain-containing protein [Aquabacterium sp.]
MMSIRSSIAFAGALLAMVPFAASAQLFVPVSQTASASAYASGYTPASDMQTGSLASLNVGVTSGPNYLANAGAHSIIRADQIGINLGVGVNLSRPPEDSPSGTYPGYPGGYSGGYDGGYEPSYGDAPAPTGSASASIELGFMLTQDTDVHVDVTDLYAVVNGLMGFNSTLALYQVNGESQTVFADRSHLAGLSHLGAGQYKLVGAFDYSEHPYNGMAGGGASVLITAVPEPASLALMGWGVLGLMLLRRRPAAASH